MTRGRWLSFYFPAETVETIADMPRKTSFLSMAVNAVERMHREFMPSMKEHEIDVLRRMAPQHGPTLDWIDGLDDNTELSSALTKKVAAMSLPQKIALMVEIQRTFTEKTIASVALETIASAGHPVATDEIADEAMRVGVKMSKLHPKLSVRQVLSRNRQFRSIKGKDGSRWWLADKPIPPEYWVD